MTIKQFGKKLNGISGCLMVIVHFDYDTSKEHKKCIELPIQKWYCNKSGAPGGFDRRSGRG